MSMIGKKAIAKILVKKASEETPLEIVKVPELEDIASYADFIRHKKIYLSNIK